MKKILLLGGSAQQVIAIETAKKLGYYTVLCDYLSDNPGQYVADKFYLVSTTDKDYVLEVAKKENIDGVIAYASDPAAPTAAYVAEKLGLPGNPYESVEILCNKDRFREFLFKNGFNTPVAKGYSNIKEAKNDVQNGIFKLPVIVKPVDSSGSKGVTVLHSWNQLDEAFSFAFSYSRSDSVIVEEFIEKKHQYLIGGDIFVIDGKIVLWGLLNCHRDEKVNSLVPVGKSYPLDLPDIDINNVKNCLSDIVTKLGIKNGSMNVELIVDKNNNVYPIDVGPRSGGNMIPDLLEYIFNVDVIQMSVNSVIGRVEDINISEPICYYATHNIHSDKDGIFEGIEFSPEIEPFVIKKCIYKKNGDIIEYFDNASKVIGILFFKFDSEDLMKAKLKSINNYIKLIVREG